MLAPMRCWMSKLRFLKKVQGIKVEIKELYRVSTIKGIFSILIEWFLIGLAIWLSEAYDSIALTALCLFFIAGRQHALGFCVHEGVHYLVSKNKKFNDFFVNIFAAWPMFMEIKTYRGNHMAHHRYNNTEKDPDWVRKNTDEWVFPRGRKKLALDFIRSFLGLESLKTFYALSGIEAQKKGLTHKTTLSKELKLAKMFYYLGLIITFSYFGVLGNFLLYWILPLLTWVQVLNRLRKISEHFGVDHEHPDYRTRTVVPNILEKIFIAPKNIHYHCEHHLYPQVPYYNLGKLHKMVVNGQEFKGKYYLSKGYLGVIRECVK